MRIGINATFLYEKPTGACIFTREVSKAMSVIHKEMLIFSPLANNDLPLYYVYKVPYGLKGSQRFSNNIYRFFYINTLLPLLCKLKGIDVLYCPILEFPFIPSVPLVVHIHDLHFIHFPSEFGLAAPRMRLSLRILKKSASRIIVSSQFVKRELLDMNIDKDRIDVVPLAYNSNLFRPVPDNLKKDFFKKYKLKERFILFVGSLFPYKNLKVLIEAFSKIKNQIPHCLVVVGRREFSTGSLVNDERILYMDYVAAEDLPFFYSCADLFVYPSLREGFGIPPLEAMACGTPVISSNKGSLPEVVGNAGILFDPEDSENLSELVLMVLNNEGLRKEMIENGLSHVKKFSWEKTAKAILKSCERALSKR